MIVQLEEAKYKLISYREVVAELGSAMKIEEIAKEIAELEEKTFAEDFWSNQENSSTVLQKLKRPRIQSKITNRSSPVLRMR